MKKQNLLLLAAAIITLGFASCNSSYKTKEVSLKSQEDSINYYLGYGNGSGIKEQYFQKDSSDKAINDFVAKLEQAFKNKDQVEKMGIQFGQYLKEQEKAGIMGDSTLKLDTKLIKQGLINALKGHKEGMSEEQAGQYFQATMQKMQEERMRSTMPAQAPNQNQEPQGAVK